MTIERSSGAPSTAADVTVVLAAGAVFDERVVEMQRLKNEGVVCSLQRTLAQPRGTRCEMVLRGTVLQAGTKIAC